MYACTYLEVIISGGIRGELITPSFSTQCREVR